MASYLGDLIPELAMDVVHDAVPVSEIEGPAGASDVGERREESGEGQSERETQRQSHESERERQSQKIQSERKSESESERRRETRQLAREIRNPPETVEATTGIEPVYTALQARPRGVASSHRPL